MIRVMVLAASAFLVTGCDNKNNDPVVHVDGDDAEMLAAEKEGRQKFGEFTAALKRNEAGANFAVKYGFPVKNTADSREFMWVDVTSISGGKIHGKLANDPVENVGYTLGQRVSVPEKEISDWMIMKKDGTMVGGFQVKVLEKRSRTK